jgi:hypothetical protein
VLFWCTAPQEDAFQEKQIASARERARVKAQQRGWHGGALVPNVRSADGGEELVRSRVKVRTTRQMHCV